MSIRKNTQCQDITISEWFGVVKLDLWVPLPFACEKPGSRSYTPMIRGEKHTKQLSVQLMLHF